MWRLKRKLQTFYRYFIKGIVTRVKAKKLLRGQSEPILVYTMAKVGSMSVTRTIQTHCTHPVFHIHSLREEEIKKSYQLCREKGWWPDSRPVCDLLLAHIKKGKRFKVICTIREPIARNISAFFDALPFYLGEKAQSYHAKKWLTAFEEQVPHDYPLRWFDQEFKQCLGVDVYAYPFDPNLGKMVIQNDQFDILIMRIDLNDDLKARYISDFLSISVHEMCNANQHQYKEYAKWYAPFKSAFRTNFTNRDIYVSRLLSSKYASHFFSADERSKILATWCP